MDVREQLMKTAGEAREWARDAKGSRGLAKLRCWGGYLSTMCGVVRLTLAPSTFGGKPCI